MVRKKANSIISRKVMHLLLALALALASHSCATVKGARGSRFSRVISTDTEWSGNVEVDGVVLVRKGATLSITPGTRVLFSGKKIETEDEHEGFSGSGIKVEGKIVAAGTKENPIIFTSSSQGGPGSWDRLYFVFSKGNIFRHCLIQQGGYAIHAHFSEITISSSLFRRNIEGVRLGGSRVKIEESVFTGNRVRGINFRESRNSITGCAIYKNGVGIFLHSKNSSSIIRNNAIYDNRRYDLQLGDLHEDGVDVSGNWWGAGASSFVDGRIYDGRDQEGIGIAAFTPFLESPRVKVSSVTGFLTYGKKETPGWVYAIGDLKDGFSEALSIASTETDTSGAFELSLPPGRFFIYARARVNGKELFGFTGGNPVLVEPFTETLHVVPLVEIEGSETVRECGSGKDRTISVMVTRDGKPVPRSFAYLYPNDTLDIRGPGISTGITSSDGRVEFRVRPGKYVVVARKRPEGRSLGIVRYGGLFGISPHIPIPAGEGCVSNVFVPVFVKEGIVSEGERYPLEKEKGQAFAFLRGSAAEDYVLYFYRSPRAVGRPEFASGVIGLGGQFSIDRLDSLEEGVYFAYLRKSQAGTAGSSEVIAAGPLEVRIEGGQLSPSVLEFE